MPFTTLYQAVREYTQPAAHLHFASTPSRSNAAVRELARAYRGTRPGFTLSTTGFHSTAHLLALLRLGATYMACFFGDNYPVPRPNPLYSTLVREGANLEHWSLAWYMAALRAGALGLPYALVHEDGTTTLGTDLAAAGRVVQMPDPARPERQLTMVAATRPDVAFVHAALADESGRVALLAPYGEGLWGALAAKAGVVATVEAVVDPATFDRAPGALILPEHRVLATCHVPGGSHPQPLYVPSDVPVPGARDDFAHYLLWRRMGCEGEITADFARLVLAGAPGESGYRSFVESCDAGAETPSRREAEEQDPMPLLAARLIVRLVRERGYRVLLAGIGRAYDACRIAHSVLAAEGAHVPVMVETGLYGLDHRAGDFPLGYDAIASASRRGGIEDVLEALACGAGNRCLAVIGAAQVDPAGTVNSTRLADGTVLVGSGGAHDLAAGADEVVVVIGAARERLVQRVDYATSSGRAVRHIVTDLGVLNRTGAGEPGWELTEWRTPPTWNPAADSDSNPLAGRCSWTPLPPTRGPAMTPPTAAEARAMVTVRLYTRTVAAAGSPGVAYA